MITNHLYPYLNANSEIVYRLAKSLKDYYCCEITIMGFRTTTVEDEPADPEGFNTICIRSITQYNLMKQGDFSRWEKLLSYIRYADCFRYLLHRKLHDKYAQSKEYQHAIEKAIKKSTFDCIIAFSLPYEILQAVSRVKTDVPIIAYKLDPWESHYYYRISEPGTTEEIKADRAAAAIITTDLIRRGYSNRTDREILDKIHVLKFPNVIEYANVKRTSLGDPEAIHCVYAGALYKDIRNPAYALKLFECLREKNIVLHLFGMLVGGMDMLDTLPENVFYHGKVSSEEALSCMSSADILVNIGNTVLNQMPSKLLTYISLGKPILNLYKDRDCPTLPYMSRYPLGLNVHETMAPTETDVSRVERFILSNRDKCVPFDTVKDLYYDCTPEYVGEKVYEIICGVTEARRRNS